MGSSSADRDELYRFQQQIIVDVLDGCAGQPEPTVEAELRRRFEETGLPCPPDPWVGAVAGEIANDRLYVVAVGTVPSDYFDSSSGRRAVHRQKLDGHRLQPDSQTRERIDVKGKPPGNQVV